MIAADDGNPATMAPMHSVQILCRRPGRQQELYPSMAPIVSEAYHARGGEAKYLPGIAVVASKGRADIHYAMDSEGKLFVTSTLFWYDDRQAGLREIWRPPTGATCHSWVAVRDF